MKTIVRYGSLTMLLALAACGSKSDGGSPAGSAAPATSSSAATAASGARAAVGKAVDAASYEGEFTSEASVLSVPDGVKWKPDDDAKDEGLGKGTIAVEVKPDGRVEGTVSGAFGEGLVRGFFDDGVLRASIVRKNPQDSGFTGTLVAAAEKPSSLDGKLSVSRGNAGALREAKVTLSKKAL